MDNRRRKVGKITALVLACTTNSLFGQTLNVVAQSAAVVDSYSGDFLFAKNENAKQYPASSTKILTALIVIESGDLDHLVTVDLADTKVEPSSLGLKPGEQYTRRQIRSQ